MGKSIINFHHEHNHDANTDNVTIQGMPMGTKLRIEVPGRQCPIVIRYDGWGCRTYGGIDSNINDVTFEGEFPP